MDTVLKIIQDFGLTFVPIFVAMDAIGVLPILQPLTVDMSNQERNGVMRLAVISALALGLVFVVIGKGIFTFLGIELSGFLVGGGFILFLLAASYKDDKGRFGVNTKIMLYKRVIVEAMI